MHAGNRAEHDVRQALNLQTSHFLKHLTLHLIWLVPVFMMSSVVHLIDRAIANTIAYRQGEEPGARQDDGECGAGRRCCCETTASSGFRHLRLNGHLHYVEKHDHHNQHRIATEDLPTNSLTSSAHHPITATATDSATGLAKMPYTRFVQVSACQCMATTMTKTTRITMITMIATIATITNTQPHYLPPPTLHSTPGGPGGAHQLR